MGIIDPKYIQKIRGGGAKQSLPCYTMVQDTILCFSTTSKVDLCCRNLSNSLSDSASLDPVAILLSGTNSDFIFLRK